MAAGLARAVSGSGARSGASRHWGLAALGRAGAGRAWAQPVGRGGRGGGAPPCAALPEAHAAGQANRMDYFFQPGHKLLHYFRKFQQVAVFPLNWWCNFCFIASVGDYVVLKITYN